MLYYKKLYRKTIKREGLAFAFTVLMIVRPRCIAHQRIFQTATILEKSRTVRSHKLFLTSFHGTVLPHTLLQIQLGPRRER